MVWVFRQPFETEAKLPPQDERKLSTFIQIVILIGVSPRSS